MFTVHEVVFGGVKIIFVLWKFSVDSGVRYIGLYTMEGLQERVDREDFEKNKSESVKDQTRTDQTDLFKSDQNEYWGPVIQTKKTNKNWKLVTP